VLLTTHLMEEAERLCDRVAIVEHGRVVDLGSPEGLVARHCPERTVVLVTADPRAPEHLQRVPEVDAVERQNGRWTVRGRGDLVTAVIGCLSERRIVVTEFRTIVPTLEDVFLRLTGHSIRD
jgi:ABC-2 type transport system ATP-binding protein